MSKYKVGDKIILTVTGTDEVRRLTYYMLNDIFNLWELSIDECAEPLSIYTEPLEDQIENLKKRLKKWVEKCTNQSAEITRLLTENKELKKDLEYYHTGTDTCDMESARITGQNEAWELARKIVLKNGYSAYDLHEIFNCCGSHQALEDFTYLEAAAKIAEWEKAKDEIKVGDVVESNNGNGERIAVIDVWSSFDGLHFEGISSNGTLTVDASAKYYTKTGRHMDIDGFLKQIGGEKE